MNQAKSKGGRPRKKAARTQTVGVRLNPDEMAELDLKRTAVNLSRCDFIRHLILEQPMAQAAIIPEINDVAWHKLAKVAANLNQYQKAINQGRATCYSLEALKQLDELLSEVRRQLKGEQL